MRNHLMPVSLAAVLLATLTGCPKAVDHYGGDGMQRPAPESQSQQSVDRAATQWALDWGPGLMGDERNFAEAYTRAAWVHAQLAAGEWEQAGEDLNVVLDQLKDVRNSENVPKAVRDRVATVLPVVRTLGRLIVTNDRNALRLASGLVAQMQATASHPAVSSWVASTGGGGGDLFEDRAAQDLTTTGPAEQAAAQLALERGPGLMGDERNYAEAYTRTSWVHMQLAAREWEQAGEDLQFVRDQLADVSKSRNVPEAVRLRVDSVLTQIDELGRLIAARSPEAMQAASRLVNAMNATTNDPTVLAWLE